MKKIILLGLLLLNLNYASAANSTNAPDKISFSIMTEKSIYENGQKIPFWFNVSKKLSDFKITYGIKDLFGNQIKKEVETENLNKKSFTPKIDEQDKVLEFYADLNINCNCSYSNHTSKYITIINSDFKKLDEEKSVEGEEQWFDEKIKESAISIEIDENSIFTFGEVINIRFEVYKGDTAKKLIEIYIEDISKKKISDVTKIYLDKKYSTLSSTVPILIKPDCKLFSNSSYFIIANGLGILAKKKIKLIDADDICKDIKKLDVGVPEFENRKSELSNNKLPKLANEVTFAKTTISKDSLGSDMGVKTLYESGSKMAEKLIVFFIVGILVLIICILIFIE